MAHFTDFIQEFSRGDTHRFLFTVSIRDSNGDPVPQNITSWQRFWLTAKRRVRDLDVDAVIALNDTTNGGIIRITPSSGVCEVKISPSHTSALTPSSRDLDLFTDIQGKDPSGEIYTLARGIIRIHGDVTRTTT